MQQDSLLAPGQGLRDLRTLEAIEECATISQRDLASRLGVAVGVANACLSRMAATGLIKVKRINSRNLTYHLTPAGFSAKARLSLAYARTTVDFYRSARQAVGDELSALEGRGIARIALIGANELAEIVGIVCAHQELTICAIADDRMEVLGTSFMGWRVCGVDELARTDCQAVIVTYMDDVEYWMERAETVTEGRVPVLRAL